MHKSLRAAFASLLTTMLIASVSVEAAQMRRYNPIGNWSISSYSNDQAKSFSHCAASVSYGKSFDPNSISMLVSIDRDYQWVLGFTSQSWNLRVSDQIPVILRFDGSSPWSGAANALSPNFAVIPMADNSRLIALFRGAYRMVVTAQGRNFPFSLDGTSRMFLSLAQCVRRELSIERGE